MVNPTIKGLKMSTLTFKDRTIRIQPLEEILMKEFNICGTLIHFKLFTVASSTLDSSGSSSNTNFTGDPHIVGNLHGVEEDTKTLMNEREPGGKVNHTFSRKRIPSVATSRIHLHLEECSK